MLVIKRVSSIFQQCYNVSSYFLGVVHTLHVSRCDTRAGQSLPCVLPVAFQYLTLQVSTHWLDIKTPERETAKEIKKNKKQTNIKFRNP